jgi:hypothetical protein
VKDRGAQLFVGYGLVDQRINAIFLRKEGEAALTGSARRLVLFVDGIVKDHDVMIFVDDLVIADAPLPGATLLSPLRRRTEHLAG